MNLKTLPGFAAILIGLAALPAQAGVVFSDNFDDGDVSDWVFSTNYNGAAGTDADGHYSPFIDAPGGGFDLYARGTKTLMLSGGEYQLTMDVRSAPCSGCIISYEVMFDGEVFTREPTHGAWIFREFNISGLSAGVHTLTLGMHTTVASTGHFVANFDNVVLTNAVPEPASWAMMIAGFGLVGAVMRRRLVLA